MGVKLLLTGPPRIGKSTVAARLVQLLRDSGIPVGGFITQERRRDGRRVGFAVRDIDGAEAVIAHESFEGGPRVGKYGVDVAAFERVGLPALRRALDGQQVIVIDEIGRMELASKQFSALVQRAFDAANPVVATAHVRRHPVTDALKQWPDVQVVMVTKGNREGLPRLVFDQFNRA